MIGVPVGIAVGRSVWQAFANSLGIVPAPVVLGWAIATVALGTIVIANLLAIGPMVIAVTLAPGEPPQGRVRPAAPPT